MPRGIYDRTKTKEQREVDKTKKGVAVKAASAPKRKYTKRAAVAAIESSPAKSVGGNIKMSAPTFDSSYLMCVEVRSNLDTLVSVANKFSDLPSVKSEVDAHVAILGKLREKMFSGLTPAEPSEDDFEDEEVAQQVQNGGSVVTTPYQASVPLPPAPSIPILPTPH